jgi:glutamate racemase
MIGVFDSGYGGLTVLKPLIKNLTEYDYIYLGDNARTPYGTRGRQTVQRYSEQAVEYLFNQGVNLVIIACNTASALALRHLQNKYPDKKILGVILPLAEKVAVAGTSGTIKSDAYKKEIQKIDPEIKVFSRACPLLVPLIEEHWQHKPESLKILKKYLAPVKSYNCDVLIPGCTHYPLMYKHFKRYMGKKVTVLDSGEVISQSLANYFNRHPEIEGPLKKTGKRKYLTTDCPEAFKNFANKELNLNIKEVQTIKLWS